MSDELTKQIELPASPLAPVPTTRRITKHIQAGPHNRRDVSPAGAAPEVTQRIDDLWDGWKAKVQRQRRQKRQRGGM